MADTVQVVRVDDVERIFPGRVTAEIEDGKLWLGDLASRVLVGDVIELTEARRNVAGQDDDGPLNGEDYIETRVVSEWRRDV